jgi:hypothetical protein
LSLGVLTGPGHSRQADDPPTPITLLPWMFPQVLTLVLGPVGDTENGEVLFWGFCEKKVGVEYGNSEAKQLQTSAPPTSCTEPLCSLLPSPPSSLFTPF